MLHRRVVYTTPWIVPWYGALYFGNHYYWLLWLDYERTPPPAVVPRFAPYHGDILMVDAA